MTISRGASALLALGALALTAACGGGGGSSPGPTPTIAPTTVASTTPTTVPSTAPTATPTATPTPMPTPTPGPVTANPNTMSFSNSTPQTTTVTEADGYAGPFTASTTTCTTGGGGGAAIATIAGNTAGNVFTVTPGVAGTCSFTFTDPTDNLTGTLDVTVTTSQVIISRKHV